MNTRLLKAIVFLPGTALVYVPALVLWLAAGTGWRASPAGHWLEWLAALAFAGPGFVLMIWTVRLFTTQGGGTPAPWDPPVNFIATGPYAHMRNPMLAGVILTLIAETLAFGSWPLAGWALFFFGLNSAYFVFSEEPGLEARFGDSYRAYKAAVPRWWPRLRPYRPE